MKNGKYIVLLHTLIIALITISCDKTFAPDPTEDYEKLFPFKGIDKPVRDETDVVVRTGDIDVTAATFKYPGDDTAPPFTRYNVTLKYTFTEADGIPGDRIDSRYVVRFVNGEKKLISIGSDPLKGYKAPEEALKEENEGENEEGEGEDEGAIEAANYNDEESEEHEEAFTDLSMEPKKTHTYRFQASSGFALFLCVNGHGVRGSRIMAEITAVSVDGSIPPVTLKVDGIQPHEGTQQLLNPYCEYVILP